MATASRLGESHDMTPFVFSYNAASKLVAMKLTARPPRGSGARPKAHAHTTTPGFTNPNQQIVVRDTGAPSKVRDGQSVYELRCGVCGFAYGCNGMDVKARLCPGCQGGTPGEVLRERERGLFD